jgi:hypothetical protein
VRFADLVLRQGHLAESALVEALTTGTQPRHLDRCDLCAERAAGIGRWLDSVKAMGLDMADEHFAPEQLLVQKDQILRRLEQLDQPSRVIAFPGLSRFEVRPSGGRRVAPAWLGVAAAAGLILGLIGGQLMARMGERQPGTASATTAEGVAPQVMPTTWLDTLSAPDIDQQYIPDVMSAINDMTPRLNSGG